MSGITMTDARDYPKVRFPGVTCVSTSNSQSNSIFGLKKKCRSTKAYEHPHKTVTGQGLESPMTLGAVLSPYGGSWSHKRLAIFDSEVPLRCILPAPRSPMKASGADNRASLSLSLHGAGVPAHIQ